MVMETNELTAVELNEQENGFIAIKLTAEQKALLIENGVQIGIQEFSDCVESTSELILPAVYEYIVLGEEKVALGYYNFGEESNRFIESNLVDLLLSFVGNQEITKVKTFELFSFYLYVIFELIEYIVDYPEMTIANVYESVTEATYESSSEANRDAFMNNYSDAVVIYMNNYKPFMNL